MICGSMVAASGHRWRPPSPPPPSKSPTSRRRRLALSVAAQLEERRWPVLLQLALVTADDIDWLTDAVREDETTGQPVLARCLERLTAPPAAADEEEKPTDEQQIDDRPDPAALRAAIVGARQDLAAWADIPIALVAENEVESLFDCDFASRRGWTLLTADEHQEVIDRGLEYVADRSSDPGLWVGKAQIGQEVVRDWSGVPAHHAGQPQAAAPQQLAADGVGAVGTRHRKCMGLPQMRRCSKISLA
jgi:hypothetical protein